jgi:diaminohydroxyphosphoribosylaminopyrimidine deaminase/5-amino-6-(5-phosphoribosylamino)uracil reductase
MDFTAADYDFMSRALRLARKGWHSTHPNPRVGCVIVKDGRIIGEGFHRRAGEPHAERMALANAKVPVVGATAYVTLEPCCHYGRTPPCTRGLIEAGVAEVIIAMQDPNPLVAGKGVQQLQDAGIKTRVGLLEQQARELNPGFIKRMSEGLPHVFCKLACSFDGRTAMASGESVWISSEQSRHDVQKLRAAASAIVTGIGTVLHDNPSLSVRLDRSVLKLDDDLPVPQPVRVIIDAELKTPLDAKILQPPGHVLIFCDQALLEGAVGYAGLPVEVLGAETIDGKINLQDVLHQLAERQINDVMVEAGAVLAGSFLEQGLLDEIIVYQAPHLMGDSARGLFHLPGLEKMNDRITLSCFDSRSFGKDIRYRFSVS